MHSIASLFQRHYAAPAAMPVRKLTPKECRLVVDPDSLKLKTTDDVAPLSGIASQHRAHKALEFGLDIRQPRFHVVAVGDPGSGRPFSARAVAKRPKVLLCDEPTGALDFKTGILVLDVLARVNRELGTTTAVITHNASIGKMADRVLTLADGRVESEVRNETKADPSELSW